MKKISATSLVISWNTDESESAKHIGAINVNKEFNKQLVPWIGLLFVIMSFTSHTHSVNFLNRYRIKTCMATICHDIGLQFL